MRTALVAAAVLALVPAAASAAYAPPSRPGPALSVPAAKLAASLSCVGTLRGASHAPVLLVPGTSLNPATDYGYGWEPALRKLGWPYCAVTLPGNAMGDIQVAGEYVVYAIRTMHAAYDGRIDIVGHSQGGMVPRWALRFWPDTRAMVDDLVGLSPSNHGTLDAIPVCAASCAPAFWQQRSNAAFIAALNSAQETFPGISYTDIYTNTDEVVVPNFGPAASSSLSRRRRRDRQHRHPVGVSRGRHRAPRASASTTTPPTSSPSTRSLTPGRPTRPASPPRRCLTPLMPGIDPSTFAANYANTLASVAGTVAEFPAHDIGAAAGLLRDRDLPDRTGGGPGALERDAGHAGRSGRALPARRSSAAIAAAGAASPGRMRPRSPTPRRVAEPPVHPRRYPQRRAPVAQWTERRTSNPLAAGSNPAGGVERGTGSAIRRW